jgi:hypothetical protein
MLEDIRVVNHDLKMFQERRAKLPGWLNMQDLPEAVKKQDLSLEGIEVMAYDIFNSQPIKGRRRQNSHVY